MHIHCVKTDSSLGLSFMKQCLNAPWGNDPPWPTVALLKFSSVLNRGMDPLILCTAVCIEPAFVLSTGCLVPVWGTAMVTKCPWAAGLAQAGIKHLGPNVFPSIPFLWGLQ